MPQPPPPARAPLLRLAVAGVFLIAGVWAFGPKYVYSFRLPAGLTTDFLQEWLSARNHFAGHPVYEHQVASAARHMPEMGYTEQTLVLHYNAHPPGSVLLALPVAGLGYRDAHLAWNLVTTPMLLLAVALAVRELCVPVRWWHLVQVAAVLIWAEPVQATILYGQLNFVLALLLTLAWVFDRRGRQVPAGVCVGLAAGLKLFPAFVFVYFLFSGRWKGLLAGVLAVAAVNAAAVAVFGVGAYQDYARDVLPDLKRWEGTWPNVSLNGLWVRALDPPARQAGPEAFRSPLWAKAGYGLSGLVLACGVAVAAWRSRTQGDCDAAWAAAVAALPLVSPLGWQHYFVILVVPLAVLAARLTGWKRYAGWVAVGGLCLDSGLYTRLLVSREHYIEPNIFTLPVMPLTPVENLLGTGMVTYFGLILFALSLWLPRVAVTPGRPAASPPPP
jgi:hypothetical protein